MFLLDTLNVSWTKGEIPEDWKHATIKPILKPVKDKNDLSSY